jgi:hypothetical protein
METQSSGPEHRMTKLARTFPTLRRVFDDLHPWGATWLERWAGTASHGERAAAQFVLAVWDPNQEWECGRFDFMDATRVFDERHRAALLDWAKDPWWP